MTKKIAAIAFIFVCTSIAWIFLASTIDYRSSAPADGLRARLANTWGAPHEQKPPSAHYDERAGKMEKVIENGKEIERIIETTTQRPVPLNGSKVNSDIHLDYRQKGLLWFSTYQVRFDAVYTFQNPANQEQLINFVFPYPAARATYDGLVLTIDGETVCIVQEAGYRKAEKKITPGGAI